MKEQFDQIISRKNTNSMKYDFIKEWGYPEHVLPLWVADMDFQAPAQVIEDLEKSVRHGIFGYTEVKGDYIQALQGWFLDHFGFDIHPSWVVKTPGVVFALSVCIRAFTNPGDAVLIQQPVYYPFSQVILNNDRKLVNNPLVYEDGQYQIDFKDFEEKIAENKVKLFILCSPHNPVGRVWTLEELQKMGEICEKYHCLVASDEIHCDFTYEGHTHHIFSQAVPTLLDASILSTAPSKTFNLAGLQVSNVIIQNKTLKRAFLKEYYKTGYSQLNTLGLVACESAYRNGRAWLLSLKEYLTDNLNYLREFLKEELPQIKLVEPQGTYLVWLDCSALHLSQKELDEFIIHKAGLWLDSGTMFGEEGTGFQRINIACPKSILQQAVVQLKEAFHQN